ncbi:MAG: hypothetical protein ACPGWR_04080 [Ardenticatenaceae bacterium]
MSTLISILDSRFFTGVPSNAVYDLIKASWQQVQQRSWEELYLDAFQAAVEEAQPHLERYVKDGEISLNRAELHNALHRDLSVSVDALPLSKLTEQEFATKLGQAMAQRSVLQIGGHTLSAQDYAQLVGNLVRHAHARFRREILADESAFRHALLSEAQTNQELARTTQDYLASHFNLVIVQLGLMDQKLDTQTELIQKMSTLLQEQSQPSPTTDPTTSQRKLIRLFIASPSDVREERDRIGEVIEDLNLPGAIADHYKVVLQILDWRDIVPGMGRPEEIILEQLPLEQWDIFIGILWTRFGTPSGGKDPMTDRFYDSGTEEEFWRAYYAWQQTGRPHILLYRRTGAPALLDAIDPDQLAKVQAFWKEFGTGGKHPGTYQTYQTPNNFERKVRRDIMRLLPSLS